MLEVSPHSDISLWEFSNYTEEQCLALEPREQVLCVVQQLNVTDPPSIYGFENFTSAWEPVACLLYNVTLQDRVDIQGVCCCWNANALVLCCSGMPVLFL